MVQYTQKINKSEILLFVTNIHHEYDVKLVAPKLNRLSSVLRWTVDLFDWERVLKVETKNHRSKRQIKKALASAGYKCKELDH